MTQTFSAREREDPLRVEARGCVDRTDEVAASPVFDLAGERQP
jgi:hypothetical protein